MKRIMILVALVTALFAAGALGGATTICRWPSAYGGFIDNWVRAAPSAVAWGSKPLAVAWGSIVAPRAEAASGIIYSMDGGNGDSYGLPRCGFAWGTQYTLAQDQFGYWYRCWPSHTYPREGSWARV